MPDRLHRQSWAVLSGAADPARARRRWTRWTAICAPRRPASPTPVHPPFDQSPGDPGYIKGYRPRRARKRRAVHPRRDVGGLAFAQLGDRHRAAELFALINPINHARTPRTSARYKVEPYVVAADVYSVAPHVGRGGWTWYTGSAGWMYRAGIEGITHALLDGVEIICDGGKLRLPITDRIHSLDLTLG
jgi:cyclic beta-1,2-glucan synthetase